MKQLITTSIIIGFITCSCTNESLQKANVILEESDLDLNEEFQSQLTAESADTFKLNLAAESFVAGYANQQTVDVVVNILDGNKQPISQYDDPAQGPEPFMLPAKDGGTYYIVISPFQKQEGKYSIKIETAEPLASSPEGRVDQLGRAMTSENGPGFSIAVAREGEVIYKNGFGLANLEYDIPNTPQTIFHIASVSKQFTAFAVAVLADQGKLSIEDDFRKYLPELQDFGTPITINQLIHHTSGLRDQWNLLMIAGWRLDDVITREHIMGLLERQRELNFEPGAEFLYCNSGFTLMAEIVSRVSGQTFPEWCKENIFDPLGMENTLFYDDHEKIVKNRAYSYYKPDSVYKKRVLSYANVGATSLFTTVEDIMKWAHNFETMTVGNADIMAMMEERYVLNNGDTINYAFGQGINEYKGLKWITHGGADAGYRTVLMRFPEQKVSIAVFSNLASFSPGGMGLITADQFLADEYVIEPEEGDDEEDSGQNTPEEDTEDVFDPKSVDLAGYVGEYYSEEIQTTYNVSIQGDTILVATHLRNPDVTLQPVAEDEFRASRFFLGTQKFMRNSGGEVKEMLISNGRVRNLSFVRVE